MSTPSLQGEIRIRTASIEQAVKKVNDLAKQVTDLGKTNKEFEDIGRNFEEMNKQAKTAAQGVRELNKSNDDGAKAAQRYDNLVAKAASSVANFAQRVKQNSSDINQQNSIVSRAYNELDRYAESLKKGGDSGLSLQTANTQLSVSLAELNRELKENQSQGQKAVQTEAQREKAVGQLTISYERLVAQIKASALSDSDKSSALARLNQQYQQSSTLIQQQGTRTTEGAKAQVAFRQEISRTTEQMRIANREYRGQSIADFNKKMQDLSSSVQVALGPLSGVASRLTAISALFRRNAASVAALIASFTGFTVLLTRVISVGIEAERQVVALDAQIQALGLSAQTSGKELNAMAHNLAAATLSSAQEMRAGQSVLLEYANIGVKSFEDVLLAAQGLSQTFGGSLAQNTARLARLLDDPISNFSALTRQGIRFNKSEQDRIRTLQETGRLTEAQNLIMERFASLQVRATGETQTLSGALDTLSGNFTIMLEKLYEQSDIGRIAAASINRLAESFLKFADSDGAVVLAESFAKAVNFAGNAVNFLVDNAKVLGALLIGAMAGGFMRVVTSTILWTFNLKKLQAGVAATVAAVRAKTAVVNGSTVAMTNAARAVTIFGAALRMAVPFVGVAVTAISLLAGMGVFTRGQKDQVDEFAESLANTKKESDRLAESLATLNIGSFNEFEELASDVSGASKELNTYYARIAELQALERKSKGFLASIFGGRGAFTPADSAELDDLLQRVKELRPLAQRLSSAYSDMSSEIKPVVEVLDEQNKMLRQSESALLAQVEAARSVTDSEGQRIDSITQSIEKLQQTIDVAEERNQQLRDSVKDMEMLTDAEREQLAIGEDLIKSAKDQVEALALVREELRQNSRANREAEREAQRLARVQADLSEAVARRAAFTEAAEGRITEAQLESRIAAIAQEKQAEKNVAAILNLTAASREALITSAAFSSSTLDWINAAGTQEERAQRIAKAYADIAQAASDAEEAQKNAAAGRDIAMRLQAQVDPARGVQRDFDEQLQALMGIPNEAEREQAIKMLEGWRDRALAAVSLDQSRELQDALSFTGLSDLDQLEREFQDREAILRERYANEQELLDQHLATLKQNYDQEKFLTTFSQNAQAAASVFEGAMGVMQAAGAQNSRAYQGMAIALGAIQQASAIAAVWADPNIPTWSKVAQSVMAGAQVGAQIATMRSQNFRDGGQVKGRGTGRSDSVSANLSKGEFVIPKHIVDMWGVGHFNEMLKGKQANFRDGGAVAMPVPVSGGSSSRGAVNVQVIDQSTRVNGVTTDVEQEYDADGELQLRVYIRDSVQDLSDMGQLDNAMGRNFGLKRKGIRR